MATQTRDALPVITVNSAGTADPAGTAADPVAVVGNVASGVADAGAPVKVGGVFNTTPAAGSTGQRRDLEVTARGSVFTTLKDTGNSVVGVLAASVANLISAGTVTLQVMGLGYKSDGTGWRADSRGALASRIVSAAASTNATVAKASAGDLHKVVGYNAAAAVRYLKVYNKATAPTVGTDTPVLTFALAPSAAFDIDLGGFYCSAGISYALTTGSADADTGALTAADIVGLNVTYA